eukprot:g5423.t1
MGGLLVQPTEMDYDPNKFYGGVPHEQTLLVGHESQFATVGIPVDDPAMGDRSVTPPPPAEAEAGTKDPGGVGGGGALAPLSVSLRTLVLLQVGTVFVTLLAALSVGHAFFLSHHTSFPAIESRISAVEAFAQKAAEVEARKAQAGAVETAQQHAQVLNEQTKLALTEKELALTARLFEVKSNLKTDLTDLGADLKEKIGGVDSEAKKKSKELSLKIAEGNIELRGEIATGAKEMATVLQLMKEVQKRIQTLEKDKLPGLVSAEVTKQLRESIELDAKLQQWREEMQEASTRLITMYEESRAAVAKQIIDLEADVRKQLGELQTTLLTDAKKEIKAKLGELDGKAAAIASQTAVLESKLGEWKENQQAALDETEVAIAKNLGETTARVQAEMVQEANDTRKKLEEQLAELLGRFDGDLKERYGAKLKEFSDTFDGVGEAKIADLVAKTQQVAANVSENMTTLKESLEAEAKQLAGGIAMMSQDFAARKTQLDQQGRELLKQLSDDKAELKTNLKTEALLIYSSLVAGALQTAKATSESVTQELQRKLEMKQLAEQAALKQKIATSVEREAANLRTQVSGMEGDVRTLKRDRAETNRNVANLRTEVQAAQKKGESLQREVSGLEEQLRNLKRDAEQHRNRDVVPMQKDVRELKDSGAKGALALAQKVQTELKGQKNDVEKLKKDVANILQQHRQQQHGGAGPWRGGGGGAAPTGRGGGFGGGAPGMRFQTSAFGVPT